MEAAVFSVFDLETQVLFKGSFVSNVKAVSLELAEDYIFFCFCMQDYNTVINIQYNVVPVVLVGTRVAFGLGSSKYS